MTRTVEAVTEKKAKSGRNEETNRKERERDGRETRTEGKDNTKMRRISRSVQCQT